MFRSRAERAAITYVDVWDGFVDEAGRFASQGPDYEGQTRRLRSGDGVYFTKFGARKLAHYVEREIQRHITNRAVPVALPIPVEPGAQPGAKPGTPAQRPTVGPAVPLTAVSVPAGAEPLMGAGADAIGRARSGRGARAHQGRADRRALRSRRRFQLAARKRAGRGVARGGGIRSGRGVRPGGRPRGRARRQAGRARPRTVSKPPVQRRVRSHDGVAAAVPVPGPVPLIEDRRRCGSLRTRTPNARCRSSAAASSTPSGTHRPRARTGGLRGSPTPPATGRGACRRPRTLSDSSCDRRGCRP